MMRRSLLLVLAALLLVAACGDDTSSGTPSVAVDRAFVPTPAGANGALYFEIVNQGDGPAHLVGASTDAADQAMIHETTSSDDGLMRMEHVAEVEIPAGESIAFEPGGLHVMLLGIDALAEGDTIEVTLEFDEIDPITIEAEVGPYDDGQR